MIAFCLICEGAIKFVDTPMGIEAHCGDCYQPVEDASEVECLRGIGEDKRDAVEDLYRVQNEYLEEATDALLVANMFEALELQLVEESERQAGWAVLFVVPEAGMTHIPGSALELAKWAAQGK